MRSWSSPVNKRPKNVEPSHNSKQSEYSGFVLYRIPFITKTKAPRNPNIRKVFFINNKNINIGVVNTLYKLPMLHNNIYLFLSFIYLQITKNKNFKNILKCFTCQVSINLNFILLLFYLHSSFLRCYLVTAR